ncbi:MAG: site-specific integrase [Betaproteobacteria bacterium]|nr:site-specific integrase [Betaproteobacteria bacterium]
MAKRKVQTESELIHLLGGAVVLYKRERSSVWQARLKLSSNKWLRASTRCKDSVKAGIAATKLYYEAETKREFKLPTSTQRFNAVADTVAAQMTAELEAGNGKVVYGDYLSCIRLYLKPFFGKYNIDSISPTLLKQFDTWRATEMGKVPVASTITTHNSALNRVFDYALEKGWTTRAVLPKLSIKGKKSETRPAFTMAEYKSLTSKMPAWVKQARMEKSKHMRELLRDYVLILANTGIRHGTEAASLKWKNIEWVIQDKERYLRLTVDGKTGPRTLIARHNTEDYLTRIQQHFAELAQWDFDTLLKKRVDEYVFRLPDGTKTKALNQTFRQLMRDSGLAVGASSEKERTLYSLRHTYATFQLLDKTSIYDLAVQMGTSVKMIEEHYSKLTPELIAAQLAGRKYGPKKKPTVEKLAPAKA